MLKSLTQAAASPARVGGYTQNLMLFVENVEAHYERAVAAGRSAFSEALNATEYGERQDVAEDQEGHPWMFAEHVRDVPPEALGSRAEMKILLIRHAEPDYPNHTITAPGHLEAQALAERLAGTRIATASIARRSDGRSTRCEIPPTSSARPRPPCRGRRNWTAGDLPNRRGNPP